MQAVSWTLTEQVRYSRTNVASGDFVSYPILRFKDSPKVTPIVVQWNTYSETPTPLASAKSPVVQFPRRSPTRSSTRRECGCERRR